MHEDQRTFLIISHSILLATKNVSDKRCRGNQNTHFVFVTFFFRKSYLFLDNVKNIVEWGWPQTIIWRMRIACWVPKATHTHTHTLTHSQSIIIIAFPPQQWLHERASMLRSTYIACLVVLCQRDDECFVTGRK